MDGIVGIYGLDDNELVSKAFLATGACQHRGKASTGLAIANRKGIYIHKGLGRIAEVIDTNIISTFQDLEPVAAIGNIGYTKGKIAEKRFWLIVNSFLSILALIIFLKPKKIINKNIPIIAKKLKMPKIPTVATISPN